MPSGREIKAALKKGSTWGTAVACGAGDGILLTKDTFKLEVKDHPDNSLGLAFAADRDQGERKAEGSLEGFLRYDGLDPLLAMVFGDAGVPSLVGPTIAYANTFKLKDTLDGIFGTLAVNKVVNVFEYPSLKCHSLTLKGEMGKPVTFTIEGIADDEVPDSVINDLTSFGNVTIPETGHRVRMSHGVIRLNNQEGAALGSGDVINITGFELSIKRKKKGEYTTGNGNRVDEPDNENLPEIVLKLSLPRYTADTYLTGIRSDQRMKADIVFTGDNIETTYDREFNLQLPHLGLLNAEALTDEGKVKHPLEFSCMAADTSPAGMTGIVKPVQLDVINTRSTSPLA